MRTRMSKRCSYDGCERPTQSSCFFTIEEGRTSGGQDWTSMTGSVLCLACYKRYKNRGTLERSAKRLLSQSARRCTYGNCDMPEQSSNFYLIEEGKNSGGQDWSSLTGSVLCHACYARFMNRGTLERSSYKRTLDPSERHCTYAECERPLESNQFFTIYEGKSSGGRDWSSLKGSILCNACYKRFLSRGTLDKQDMTGSKRQKKAPTIRNAKEVKEDEDAAVEILRSLGTLLPPP